MRPNFTQFIATTQTTLRCNCVLGAKNKEKKAHQNRTSARMSHHEKRSTMSGATQVQTRECVKEVARAALRRSKSAGAKRKASDRPRRVHVNVHLRQEHRHTIVHQSTGNAASDAAKLAEDARDREVLEADFKRKRAEMRAEGVASASALPAVYLERPQVTDSRRREKRAQRDLYERQNAPPVYDNSEMLDLEQLIMGAGGDLPDDPLRQSAPAIVQRESQVIFFLVSISRVSI